MLAFSLLSFLILCLMVSDIIFLYRSTVEVILVHYDLVLVCIL